MDQELQWAITTIVGILGIVAGRAWGLHDRKLKKDQNLVDKIINIMPIDSETLRLLRDHDFGGWFERRLLRSLHELREFLDQPSYFFLNKELEQKKKELQQAVTDFLALVGTKTFVNNNLPDFQGLDNPDDALVRAVHHRQIAEPVSEEEVAQIREQAWNNYLNTKNELNSKSNEICKKYDALITTSHRKL